VISGEPINQQSIFSLINCFTKPPSTKPLSKSVGGTEGHHKIRMDGYNDKTSKLLENGEKISGNHKQFCMKTVGNQMEKK